VTQKNCQTLSIPVKWYLTAHFGLPMSLTRRRRQQRHYGAFVTESHGNFRVSYGTDKFIENYQQVKKTMKEYKYVQNLRNDMMHYEYCRNLL
jgi:hypothetical protein